MCGTYNNGNTVKPVKLEALRKDLADYIKALGKARPSHARMLNAQLHERSVALDMAAVQSKARAVNKGCRCWLLGGTRD